MFGIVNFVAHDSSEMRNVPVGCPGVDRDGSAVVKYREGVLLFVPEQAGWAHIGNDELDGVYTEDGVSRFFPITFGGAPARL
jgi:hypothetical protein